MALTDTEIDAKAEDWLNVSAAGPDAKLFRYFARAIEAASVAPLLERIAALEAQVEQAAQPFDDPFTYVIQHLNSNPYALTKDECIEKIKELRVLYTSPPKAVPLTPDELADKCEAYLQSDRPQNMVDSYEAGYRDCEASNGITPATVEKG